MRLGFPRVVFNGLLCLALNVTGCTLAQQGPYYEKHEFTNLTVVLLDEESLRKQYESLSGQSSVKFSSFSPSITVNTVRGFFDFRTNTIYCPKMAFEVCGHELHHALMGHFHPSP